MKKGAIIGSSLIFITSTLFAATFSSMSTTDMAANWICTTNASPSKDSYENDADRQMINITNSAANAFNFAMQHCRDCTKIICHLKN